MAGEVVGLSFETLVDICLSKLGVEYHWGVKPEGFSVDPDFIIGNILTPSCWLMLTSSYSTTSSDKKFWRNVAETAEVKTHFAKPPGVLNLVLESSQIGTLERALQVFVDGKIQLSDTVHGGVIRACLEKNVKSLTGDKKSRRLFLLDLIESDSIFGDAVKVLGDQLKNALNRAMKAPSSYLWATERNRRLSADGAVRSHRITSVRRGLAKLWLFPRHVVDEILENNDRPIRAQENLQWAVEAGIFRKNSGKLFLADQDVAKSIRLIGSRVASEVIDSVNVKYAKTREGWIKQLESSSDAATKRFVELLCNRVTPEALERSFDISTAGEPRHRFWDTIQFLKVLLGGRQRYGFGVLAQDVGYADGISRGYKWLADWANGKADSAERPKLVVDVCRALAARLGSWSVAERQRAVSKSLEGKINGLIEQKVVTYNMFQPLKIILESGLRSAKIPFKSEDAPTVFSDFIGEPGRITTPVVRVGNTLIHWKSAYDLGRTHKVKELSGRAFALRYGWNGKKYVLRDANLRLFLFIDGTWQTKDLSTLRRAGWDDFFYPDEVQELTKAIV